MARPIQFGLFQPQIGLPFPLLKERALACEEYGFHSIWFTDHMWPRGMTQVDFLEGWTVMSSMAMVTTTLRIGGLVLQLLSEPRLSGQDGGQFGQHQCRPGRNRFGSRLDE